MSGYKRTRYIGFGSGISITPLNASNPIKTGQTTSYRTGDDGNLQIGRLVNFLTLDFTNPFGHTRRFTGITGGYHDGTDWVDVNGNSTTEALAFPNDIAIDWSQFNQVGGLVLGSVRTALSSTTWNNQIDNALALSVGAFTSGWRLLNANEANTFIDYSINGSCLSYHPFIMRTQGFIWLSTTYAVNTGRAMLIATANNRLGDAAKGNNSNGIAVRNFTLTELGLSGYGPCADATIEVNSNALTTVPSGGTLDIEVKYENGTPVGTIVSPTLVEIPNPITPTLCNSMIGKSGQTTSYYANDDGARQTGRGASFLVLDENNPFGHTRRFTGITGGYHNGTTWVDVNGNSTTEALAFPNDWVIDWLYVNEKVSPKLVQGHYRVPTTTDTFANAMNAQPYTVGGYSDVYIVPINVLMSIRNAQNINTGNTLNYPPFNYAITGTNTTRPRSSTNNNSNAVALSNLGVEIQITVGTSQRHWLGRIFTYTELGL